MKNKLIAVLLLGASNIASANIISVTATGSFDIDAQGTLASLAGQTFAAQYFYDSDITKAVSFDLTPNANYQAAFVFGAPYGGLAAIPAVSATPLADNNVLFQVKNDFNFAGTVFNSLELLFVTGTAGSNVLVQLDLLFNPAFPIGPSSYFNSVFT